jgi:hypothetical protein
MSEKATVKVIEVTGVKLNPKAKYIIQLSPEYADWYDEIGNELDRLIGQDQFTLLPLVHGALRVIEVMPDEKA